MTSWQRDTYNSLFDVAEADDRLVASGKSTHLHRLLSIIRDHGAHHHMGIRLLHRHNLIEEGEIMIADTLDDDEGFAVVSQAMSGADTRKDVVPSSWQLVGSDFAPSEFSLKHLVREDSLAIHESDALLRDLAAAVHEMGVQNLLGPCLNMNDWVYSHSPTKDAILLEKTNHEHRANVSRFVSEEEFRSVKSRETTWQVSTASGSGIDHPGNLIAKCKCACSVATGGGHLGTHVWLGH
ncbi:hypothetical protein [Methylobacterium sp. Leaf111]|uniref:hypothetical protein n=1 Tax=Methylobacterium sp. Leaf111 TaxID=1736257 RepID=UPI0012E70F34|nr:hypothetical protein [Methylobacterium sp. Leaf111]